MLHISASLNRCNILRILLTNDRIKRMTNVWNNAGNTSIIEACISGCSECVALLLEYSDLSIASKKGYTALHAAAGYGNVEALKTLLGSSQIRSILNVQNDFGITALLSACFEGNYECVELLLNAECMVNLFDNEGNTAFHIASMFNNVEVLRLLIQHSTASLILNNQNVKGNTALMECVLRGFEECVVELLEAKCAIDIRNNEGNDCFDLASSVGQIRILDLLQKQKNKIN